MLYMSKLKEEYAFIEPDGNWYPYMPPFPPSFWTRLVDAIQVLFGNAQAIKP